ncbi:MAG: CoA pyrophosphatase [Desulfobacteraceae bacterium]|nr:MAG: CoA pyrophosphatase [Desulfobacteraceae bacterium]
MGNKNSTTALLENPRALKERIQRQFGVSGLQDEMIDMPAAELKNASAVLFLLSHCDGRRDDGRGPCVILNKRSAQVRQGGDLCCPGGGISWRTDRFLAKLLNLPGSPLRRWPWRRRPHVGALNVLLAAGLRESWEEMRLNPLRFDFLGLLPQQHLVMFDRVIYPMVGWVSSQQLTPNWEVERIVHVPLRELLDRQRYGRFRPMVAGTPVEGNVQPLRYDDFPCFMHQDEQGMEMLWGATYRITQSFLSLVFDFSPPDTNHLPLAHRHLDDSYLNGSRWHPASAYRNGKADW